MAISRRQLVAGGSGVALSGLALAVLDRRLRRAMPPATPPTAPRGSTCSSPTAPARAAAVPVRPALRVYTLAKFVDALPRLPRLSPGEPRSDPEDAGARIASYRVAMRETEVRVHRDLPPTRMWAYEGSVPGPVLEPRSGQPFLVEWANELPTAHFLPIDHTLHGAGTDRPEVRAVVHLHGASVPPGADGHPESWYVPGKSAAFRYPCRQEAATLWYHDHAMGIERLNQYAGLFGVALVRDAVEGALPLPKDDREIPLVLCDRFFDEKGQLVYPSSNDPGAPWTAEVFGDAHLVNGKLAPFCEVAPGRYRLRVVNASNARVYYLSFAVGAKALTFHQIGSDQGLLAGPAPLTSLTLAPAERADVVVDFGEAAGQAVVLTSQTLELMQFRVGAGVREPAKPLPRVLRPIERIPAAAAVKTRTLTLNDYKDPHTGRMKMLLNASYWHDPVTEKPVLGSTEIWELVNLTEDMHPIHLHLVRFQILERRRFDPDVYLATGETRLIGEPVPPTAGEMGWKDTVRAEVGMITRIVARFDGYPGSYVWHCHVLEHAANEMMRPFEVVGL